MKIKRICIVNIGAIADEEIVIDKPLIIFYGEIRQGKSTILNAVRWAFGGAFPSDIIRHGAREASIELHLDNGIISRTFYKDKTDVTKARPIIFIRDGKPVNKPVAELEKLVNPFVLDQEFLVKKNELERQKYFTELFGVDTSAEDAALAKLEQQATTARAELKGYGDIDLTQFTKVSVQDLRDEKARIIKAHQQYRATVEAQIESVNTEHNTAVAQWQADNNAILEHNRTFQRGLDSEIKLKDEILNLEAQLKEKKEKLAGWQKWMQENPKKVPAPEPVKPDTAELQNKLNSLSIADTSAIDERIENALANNIRAEQYEKNVARDNERKAKANTLSDLEAEIRRLREDRLAKLSSVNDKHNIAGLVFTDDGGFTYEGATASMLSTSQLMELSSKVSALYPEGLQIELIDRGESLGKSIFGYVDRAKAENKTILATVVGERPAVVPEEVGVFVVEKGEVL